MKIHKRLCQNSEQFQSNRIKVHFVNNFPPTNCNIRVNVSVSQLMAVSGVKMLVQMTCGVLVLCFLSESYKVQNYRAVKSDSGEVLCAASPPNKTLNAVAVRNKCTIECRLCTIECGRGKSPCQALNYRQTTQLCELFYYEPCSYNLQPDCYNFLSQVVNNLWPS